MPQNDSRLQSAAQWFHYAEADMRAAKLLRDAKEHPAACFDAQQAAEKAFKGLLSIVGEVKKVIPFQRWFASSRMLVMIVGLFHQQGN